MSRQLRRAVTREKHIDGLNPLRDPDLPQTCRALSHHETERMGSIDVCVCEGRGKRRVGAACVGPMEVWRVRMS